MARLENRADAHRELLAAFATLLEAVALYAFRVLFGRLRTDAFQLIDFAGIAAMGAVRAVRPDNLFQLDEGRSLVMKIGSTWLGLRITQRIWPFLVGLSSI